MNKWKLLNKIEDETIFNKIILEKDILLEATKYDKQAIEILNNANLFSPEVNEKIIQLLHKGDENNNPDIQAFVRAPNWTEKYLKGIARMLVEYANGSQQRAKEFLTELPLVFEPVLTWIKKNRTEKNAKEIDDNIVNKFSFEDLKKFLEKIQAEYDKESEQKLATIDTTKKSNYELIPINNYKEFEKFGHGVTGDCTGNDSAWCHAYSERVYNSWIQGNKYKIYVLAVKNYKHIKPVKGENSPKDEYGLSLIAIRVNISTGRLINATLRWNHINVESNSDNQFKSYGELSEVAGFNVEEKVKRDTEDERKKQLEKFKYLTTFYYNKMKETGKCNSKTILDDDRDIIIEIVIPDNIKRITAWTFDDCRVLKSVTIPNSVVTIDYYSFRNCKSLESIIIPNSVTSIGCEAFRGCTSLESIDILSTSVKIYYDIFNNCPSLTSISYDNIKFDSADKFYNYVKNKNESFIRLNKKDLEEDITEDYNNINQELEQYIKDNYKINPLTQRGVILSDGTVIENPLDEENYYISHGQLMQKILGNSKLRIVVPQFNFYDEIWENYGIIRINKDYEHTLLLAKQRPTIQQYKALEKWLDYYINDEDNYLYLSGKYSTIGLTFKTEKYGKTLVTSSEEIIDMIKQYYRAGTFLTEELNENYSNTKPEFEKYLKDNYKTNPLTLRGVILSDGTVVENPESDFAGWRYMSHYEFLKQIRDKTKFTFLWKYAGYMLDNIWHEINLIRVNAEYEDYFVLPVKRPTPQQYSALEKWIDNFFKIKPAASLRVSTGGWGGISFVISNPVNKEIQISSGADILDYIKDYYRTGAFLTENINENLLKQVTHIRFINQKEYEALQKNKVVTPIDTDNFWARRKLLFTFPMWLTNASFNEYFSIAEYLNKTYNTNYSHVVFLDLKDNKYFSLVNYMKENVDKIINKELSFPVESFTETESFYLVPETRVGKYVIEDVVEIKTINKIGKLNESIDSTKFKYKSLEELLPYTENEILALDEVKNAIVNSFRNISGPIYLTPNGTIIDIDKYLTGKVKNRWKVHREFIDNIFWERFQENKIISSDMFEDENLMAYLENDAGFIRLNNGASSTDSRVYLTLIKSCRPTEKQYNKIIEFLDTNSRNEVIIYLLVNRETVKTIRHNSIYSENNETVDELIKRIKRWYTTGTVIESLEDFPKVGYRNNLISAQIVRLKDIIKYEVFELGNIDILDRFISYIPYKKELDKKTLDQLKQWVDNQDLLFEDDITKDEQDTIINALLKALNKATGKQIEYGLWLASKDVIQTFYDGEEGKITKYKTSDIILSDLGFDDQGILFGYETNPYEDAYLKEELNIKIPKYLYHATTSDKIRSIKALGLGADISKKMWTGGVNKYKKKTHGVFLDPDPYNAYSFVEISDEYDEDEQSIVVFVVDTDDLDKSKLSYDENNRVDIEEYRSFFYDGVIPYKYLKIELEENLITLNKEELLENNNIWYEDSKIKNKQNNLIKDKYKYHNDCQTRALSYVYEIEYNKVRNELNKINRVNYQGRFNKLHDYIIDDFIKKHGYKQWIKKSSLYKYKLKNKTVEQFTELFSRGKYILKTDTHVVGVVNGKYLDVVDSSQYKLEQVIIIDGELIQDINNLTSNFIVEELTKEQEIYFKNSKVRDEQGNLLVVYHGTKENFNEFKYGDIGFHFGNSEHAGAKGKQINKYYLNLINPYRVNEDMRIWDGTMGLTLWLITDHGFPSPLTNEEKKYIKTNFKGLVLTIEDILNPNSIYYMDELQEYSEQELKEYLLEVLWDWRVEDAAPYNHEINIYFRQLFQKRGYDGIIYPNEYEYQDWPTYEDSYIAFYPNQIKSIDNKNPTNSNRIDEAKEDTLKFIAWAGDDLATKFTKVKPRLKGQERDYYYWMKKDKGELEAKLAELDKIPTVKQKREYAKEGAEKIYEDNIWLILKITTIEASRQYGINTEWCISGGYADEYFKPDKGEYYYFYINKKENTKYALFYAPKVTSHYTIWNDVDEVVVKIPNAPKIKELPDVGNIQPGFTQGLLKLGIKEVNIKNMAQYNDFIFNNKLDRIMHGLLADYIAEERGSVYIIELKNGELKYILIKENDYEFNYLKDITTEVEERLPEYLDETIRLNKNDLIESLSSEDQKTLEEIDKLFGQKELYMWSTYILPNGHFLNPENGLKDEDDWSDLMYEHEDFQVNIFADDGTEIVNHYKVSAFYDNHCIKMNITYPYLFLPKERVTYEQLEAIKKIFSRMDILQNYGEEYDGILILKHNNTEKLYNWEDFNERQVIRDIIRSYSIGFI